MLTPEMTITVNSTEAGGPSIFVGYFIEHQVIGDDEAIARIERVRFRDTFAIDPTDAINLIVLSGENQEAAYQRALELLTGSVKKELGDRADSKNGIHNLEALADTLRGQQHNLLRDHLNREQGIRRKSISTTIGAGKHAKVR